MLTPYPTNPTPPQALNAETMYVIHDNQLYNAKWSLDGLSKRLMIGPRWFKTIKSHKYLSPKKLMYLFSYKTEVSSSESKPVL